MTPSPRHRRELGKDAKTNEFFADRDKDCVPEIDDGKLSALLAKEYVLIRK